MGDFLNIVGYLSLGAGPFLSNKTPAMPPDLQPWALWLSGIAAFVGLVVTKVRLKDPIDPRKARRHLIVTGVGAVTFAVVYFAIALIWRSETGDWRDLVFQMAAVGAYSLCFACITAVTAAGDKLTQ